MPARGFVTLAFVALMQLAQPAVARDWVVDTLDQARERVARQPDRHVLVYYKNDII